MEYVDPNDTFYVEIREYDAAGNPGPTGSFVLAAPSATATRAFWVAPVLACLRFCPKGMKYVLKKKTHDVAKVAKATASVSPLTIGSLQAVWDSRRMSRSGAARGCAENHGGGPQEGGRGRQGRPPHRRLGPSCRPARTGDHGACDVDPNEAANGVFLTKELHDRTLPNLYYENVNRLLEPFWEMCAPGSFPPFGLSRCGLRWTTSRNTSRRGVRFSPHDATRPDAVGGAGGCLRRMEGHAESAVVEWRYAPIAANWQRPIPYWNAIHGLPLSTRARSRPPANPATAEHYGVDVTGRIVVARSFDGGGHLASKSCSTLRRERPVAAAPIHQCDPGWSVTARELLTVSVQRSEPDGQISYARVSEAGRSERRYKPTYRDGRIVGLVRESKTHALAKVIRSKARSQSIVT